MLKRIGTKWYLASWYKDQKIVKKYSLYLKNKTVKSMRINLCCEMRILENIDQKWENKIVIIQVDCN